MTGANRGALALRLVAVVGLVMLVSSAVAASTVPTGDTVSATEAGSAAACDTHEVGHVVQLHCLDANRDAASERPAVLSAEYKLPGGEPLAIDTAEIYSPTTESPVIVQSGSSVTVDYNAQDNNFDSATITIEDESGNEIARKEVSQGDNTASLSLGSNVPDGSYDVVLEVLSDWSWAYPTEANAVIVDDTPPSVDISSPTDDTSHTSPQVISGTASDGVSGLDTVELQIENGAGDTWDGSSFTTGETWVTPSGTSAWSYDTAGVGISTDGTYTVTARATDNATNTETTSMSYAVDSVDPTFKAGASNSTSIAEGSTGTVLDVEADDDAGSNYDTGVSYSLGGDDAGFFSIDTTTGEVALDSPLDFESPSDTDANNDYELTVTATDDASNSNQQTLTVSITDLNEDPTLSKNSGLTVDEGANARAITTATLSATDPEGDALTYDVTSGVNHGTLFIDGTGAGSADGTLDGEAPIGTGTFTQVDINKGALLYSHDGSATTSDSFEFDLKDGNGGSLTDQTVAITVTEAPTVTSITRASRASPTNADSVDFDLTVSESVTGVDAGDFTLTTTDSATTANGDGDISVTGTGSRYTVTVDNVAGDGDLRLDLVDDDSITSDRHGVPLGGVGTTGDSDGGFTGGETYRIDNTAPTADAGSDLTVDEGTAAAFDGTGSTDNVGIVSYEWDFGDGTPNATGPKPTHSYAGLGTYTVTVTTTDAAGNADTDTMAVTVADATRPVAEAGPDRTVKVGTPVSFDATESTDDTGVVSYWWEFGDGGLTNAPTPTHTYTEPGTYTVRLTVSDAARNKDADTATVTVVANDSTPPTADAGEDRRIEVNETVAFDATDSTDDGQIASYEWDFGDGTNGTGETTAHTYESSGTYTVTLTVTDAAGNVDTDTVSVTVSETTEPESPVFTDPLPETGATDPPRDLDGDGRYEDVDGDGDSDFDDGVALAFVEYDALTTDQQRALDFDDDGDADFDDAIELAFTA
ncbi:MAG: PKD domain-containing protein [Halobacteriota archaeon]